MSDPRSEERLAAIRKLRDDHPNDAFIQAAAAEGEAAELAWQEVSKDCISEDGNFDFAQLLRNTADLMDGKSP